MSLFNSNALILPSRTNSNYFDYWKLKKDAKIDQVNRLYIDVDNNTFLKELESKVQANKDMDYLWNPWDQKEIIETAERALDITTLDKEIKTIIESVRPMKVDKCFPKLPEDDKVERFIDTIKQKNLPKELSEDELQIDLEACRPDCLDSIYLPPMPPIELTVSKKALKLLRDIEDPEKFISKIPFVPTPELRQNSEGIKAWTNIQMKMNSDEYIPAVFPQNTGKLFMKKLQNRIKIKNENIVNLDCSSTRDFITQEIREELPLLLDKDLIFRKLKGNSSSDVTLAETSNATSSVNDTFVDVRKIYLEANRVTATTDREDVKQSESSKPDYNACSNIMHHNRIDNVLKAKSLSVKKAEGIVNFSKDYEENKSSEIKSHTINMHDRFDVEFLTDRKLISEVASKELVSEEKVVVNFANEQELNESSGLKLSNFNDGFDTKSLSDKKSTSSVKESSSKGENIVNLNREYDTNESLGVKSPTKDEPCAVEYLSNKKLEVNMSSELKPPTFRLETDLNYEENKVACFPTDFNDGLQQSVTNKNINGKDMDKNDLESEGIDEIYKSKANSQKKRTAGNDDKCKYIQTVGCLNSIHLTNVIDESQDIESQGNITNVITGNISATDDFNSCLNDVDLNKAVEIPCSNKESLSTVNLLLNEILDIVIRALDPESNLVSTNYEIKSSIDTEHSKAQESFLLTVSPVRHNKIVKPQIMKIDEDTDTIDTTLRNVEEIQIYFQRGPLYNNLISIKESNREGIDKNLDSNCIHFAVGMITFGRSLRNFIDDEVIPELNYLPRTSFTLSSPKICLNEPDNEISVCFEIHKKLNSETSITCTEDNDSVYRPEEHNIDMFNDKNNILSPILAPTLLRISSDEIEINFLDKCLNSGQLRSYSFVSNELIPELSYVPKSCPLMPSLETYLGQPTNAMLHSNTSANDKIMHTNCIHSSNVSNILIQTNVDPELCHNIRTSLATPSVNTSLEVAVKDNSIGSSLNSGKSSRMSQNIIAATMSVSNEPDAEESVNNQSKDVLLKPILKTTSKDFKSVNTDKKSNLSHQEKLKMIIKSKKLHKNEINMSKKIEFESKKRNNHPEISNMDNQNSVNNQDSDSKDTTLDQVQLTSVLEEKLDEKKKYLIRSQTPFDNSDHRSATKSIITAKLKATKSTNSRSNTPNSMIVSNDQTQENEDNSSVSENLKSFKHFSVKTSYQDEDDKNSKMEGHRNSTSTPKSNSSNTSAVHTPKTNSSSASSYISEEGARPIILNDLISLQYDLISELESRQGVIVFHRNLSKFSHSSHPDIISSPNTCIYILSGARQEKDIQKIYLQMSASYSDIWFLILIEPHSEYLNLYESGSQLEFKVKREMWKCRPHSLIIPATCLADTIGQIVYTETKSAHIGFGLQEYISCHEIFLLTIFPSLNSFSAQLLLQSASLPHILQLQTSELIELCPWLPQDIAEDIYRICSSKHSLKNNLMLTNEDTDTSIDYQLSNQRGNEEEEYEDMNAVNFFCENKNKSLDTSCNYMKNKDDTSIYVQNHSQWGQAIKSNKENFILSSNIQPDDLLQDSPPFEFDFD